MTDDHFDDFDDGTEIASRRSTSGVRSAARRTGRGGDTDTTGGEHDTMMAARRHVDAPQNAQGDLPHAASEYSAFDLSDGYTLVARRATKSPGRVRPRTPREIAAVSPSRARSPHPPDDAIYRPRAVIASPRVRTVVSPEARHRPVHGGNPPRTRTAFWLIVTSIGLLVASCSAALVLLLISG